MPSQPRRPTPCPHCQNHDRYHHGFELAEMAHIWKCTECKQESYGPDPEKLLIVDQPVSAPAAEEPTKPWESFCIDDLMVIHNKDFSDEILFQKNNQMVAVPIEAFVQVAKKLLNYHATILLETPVVSKAD